MASPSLRTLLRTSPFLALSAVLYLFAAGSAFLHLANLTPELLRTSSNGSLTSGEVSLSESDGGKGKVGLTSLWPETGAKSKGGNVWKVSPTRREEGEREGGEGELIRLYLGMSRTTTPSRCMTCSIVSR